MTDTTYQQALGAFLTAAKDRAGQRILDLFDLEPDRKNRVRLARRDRCFFA